ncbi:MAG: hypothetical protein COT55_01665 [Candidatus Diapherotrites archaeon CG09_land_8_20_14_0_10_32_12]|nr:MAG: hypothetical protein COT55_01665 [Candidatus Diapherotrites archaeon CG09_land_8_20_14_0_10_32_12]
MNEIIGKIKSSGRAAFRTKEFAVLLGKKEYARQVLHRLKEKNELISIKKGWWAFPDAMPEAVACELFMPCYISFHSALYLHGLTTQIPKKVQLAVTKNSRSISVFGVQIKKYKIKQKEFNSFCKKDNLLLASKEKAFADAVNYPRSCPEIVLKEAISCVELKQVRTYLNSEESRRRFLRLIKYVNKR